MLLYCFYLCDFPILHFPLQLADYVALLTIVEGGWGIRLPITNFMENGQAQYKWMNDFDYLVVIPQV